MSQSIRPGEIIYADGAGFDVNWVDTLYGAGSLAGYAQFKIVHTDVVMLPLLQKIEFDDKKHWQLYENLKSEARRMIDGRHRTVVDVQYLIELWELCMCMSRSI